MNTSTEAVGIYRRLRTPTRSYPTLESDCSRLISGRLLLSLPDRYLSSNSQLSSGCGGAVLTATPIGEEAGNGARKQQHTRSAGAISIEINKARWHLTLLLMLTQLPRRWLRYYSATHEFAEQYSTESEPTMIQRAQTHLQTQHGPISPATTNGQALRQTQARCSRVCNPYMCWTRR